MAEPQFTSQQSEILINVSEDHSYAKSSPQAPAEPPAHTQVEQSPSVQASSNPGFIRDSPAERVEDSYQESLRPPVPAQLPEDDDDDEDLYSVSPNGKAKLETAIEAARITQEEQVW
jgi:hypothetical protein